MTNLKPCPFCGSEKVEVWNTAVYCKDCLAEGPADYSIDGQIAAWNRRVCYDQSQA
jgi:Lar family restriction alleviation protein